MKKKMDKLKEIIASNKRIIIFLLGLTIVAIIFGAIFITILSKNDQGLVKNYLEQFLNNIENNKLDYWEAFKNSFISNLILILIIWILGISVIGIPIMIFIFFVKSFILGFSISSIIFNYKLKGCLLSFLYIFPHHIINLFLLMFLVIYAFAFSIKIINALFNKKTIDFKLITNKYLTILIFCTIGILLTTLIEVFLTPLIIKPFLSFIK